MTNLQDYTQMCDETKDWMIEKDQALTTDDTGRDLAGVQMLQRRHQVLVFDMSGKNYCTFVGIGKRTCSN